MKKFLIAFLIVSTLLLSGCFNQSAQIINNSFYSHNISQSQSTEVVGEVYAFNLSMLNLNSIEKAFYVNEIAVKLNEIKNSLLSEFSNKISQEPLESQQKYNGKVAFLVSSEQDVISLKINFENKDVWKFFSSSEQGKPEYQKSLFVVKRIDVKQMFGATTNLSGEQKIVGEYVKEQIFALFDFNDLSNIKYLSSFNYITSIGRIHSTSDAYVSYDGLCYHQWDTSNSQPQIKIWICYANVVSWYILALILTAIIVAVFVLISTIKTKKNKKDIFFNEITNE